VVLYDEPGKGDHRHFGATVKVELFLHAA